MTKRMSFAQICILLLAAGCGAAPVPAPPPGPPPAPSPPPTPQPPPPPAAPSLPAAPWSGERLAAAAVPEAYVTEWRKAENRSACALIAPASLGEGEGARPRSATFSGGWAVAYDRSGLRSAFGIAGTGSRASDLAYDAWPHRRAWADGSSAGYGPEGGTGPNELAYLRIAGQDCLYNVWSRLGRAHLERLLESLRFVVVP
ncbi:MAG TPA: hypothetical protein VFR37_20590 [Longimicrobium sp.]|nr:hypothetical protein [Longimicrobium sp.]